LSTESPNDANKRTFLELSIVVLGLLGGLAMSALALVINNPLRFEPTRYPVHGKEFLDMLMLVLGTTALFCVFASFLMIGIGAGLVRSNQETLAHDVSAFLMVFSLVGIGTSVELLALSFSWFDGVVLGCMFVGLVFIFISLVRSFRSLIPR